MNCKSCGISLPDAAIACWKCGSPIAKLSSETQTQSAQTGIKELSKTTQDYLPWKIGCLLYGLIAPLIMAWLNGLSGGTMNDAMYTVLLMLAVWLSGSVMGVILLAKKEYRAGCALLILAGVTGPLLWLVALFLPARMRCPACREIIAGDATRCSHCATVVTPII
jgi:hypothetical protein